MKKPERIVFEGGNWVDWWFRVVDCRLVQKLICCLTANSWLIVIYESWNWQQLVNRWIWVLELVLVTVIVIVIVMVCKYKSPRAIGIALCLQIEKQHWLGDYKTHCHTLSEMLHCSEYLPLEKNRSNCVWKESRTYNIWFLMRNL